MSNIAVILVVLVLFTLLLLFGFYVHSVLLAAGVIGLVFLEGLPILSGLLGNAPFHSTASYTLTTIPMFVLMAQFALQSGIVQDVFYIVNRVSRGRNSFLGALTIVVGGFLGAVSGSGTATSASLGHVAVPELIKHRFKPALAGAVAASGGSLSSIIPPSIILIVYGVATLTPVGDLFISAVIPGILVMIVYMIVMYVCLRFSRKTVEDRSSSDPRDGEEAKVPMHRLIIASLVGIILITVIFGGIYTGVVTPTEAGAIGALVAFIAVAVLGKLNINVLKSALTETIKVTAMVMLIMIGAQVFGRFISLSQLPRQLINLLEPIMDAPTFVLLLLLLVFLILFMFIEGAAVILMTIPVVLPIIEAIQVDVLWFGTFIGVIGTIGLITPPVGLSVYAVSGSSKISSDSIFQYAMVFALAATFVVGGLMIAFPEIALWLPRTME